jgi:serine/threonine-protein kinase
MEHAKEQALIGTVIADRYRLASVLGAGAMGAVYRADALDGSRPIAIKVLRTHLSTSSDADARFRREGFVGGRIDHPNCVAVSDFGTFADGSPYLAMELLDGESLGDLLEREGSVPWKRALRIARHVLCGLAHAHRKSIVHRDIKPDNIFLVHEADDPDFAKILDFGIAKLVAEGVENKLTHTGVSVGTPAYLSPEQGLGGTVDGRSDLYSLSVVLFEMLTGRRPFDNREAIKTLFAHATDEVPRFAAIAPEIAVPPEVEALVRAGLSKMPGERIPSAANYIRRIDALLRLPRRRRMIRRIRRGLLAVAGAAVLAAVVALVLTRPWASAENDARATAESSASLPPEVSAAIHNLVHGNTCAARLRAVQRLAALQHPGAIPALRRARGRWRDGKNTNACLRAAAEKAIDELR